MNSISLVAPALPADRAQSDGGRRAIWIALLLAGMLAAAGAAEAANITVITSGTITSGSDSGDLFGAGPALDGDSYTLTVEYGALGAAYFTTGTFGSDVGDPITGFVTATIDGTSITTDLTDGTTATLIENLNSLFAGNTGFDAADDFTNVSQGVGSANDFVPITDLQTEFTYAPRPGDTALDTYLFTNASDTERVSFSGAPTSLEFRVPEPESWAMMATGLLGLGLLAGVGRKPKPVAPVTPN